ncbi:MAG: hypothetical protein IPK16_15130 [Anaerolineales bacterium]|nr:hypothetical protein [Anaerolineales bacterium]
MNQPNALAASGPPQTGRRNRTAARRATWAPALVMGAVAASILFLSLAKWPDTPDGWLHLQRTRALGEAFRYGVLYPHWFPDFSFGYGYPVLNFYSPAFYYPPALLAWLGVGVVDAVRISLAVGYGISAAAMYILLRTRSSGIAALTGTVLFLLFPYRLYDLFVRGALPEFAAFMWLPLIVYFSWPPVNSGDIPSKVWRLPPGGLAASLCWAGLILTHNLTAMMAAVMAAGAWILLAIVTLVRVPRAEARSAVLWRYSLHILVPVLLGALLSAWYWVPALMEAGWVGIGAGASGAGYANHFATWGDLFTWALVYPYPAAAAPTVPLPSWILAVLLLAAIGVARKSTAPLRTALLLPCGGSHCDLADDG